MSVLLTDTVFLHLTAVQGVGERGKRKGDRESSSAANTNTPLEQTMQAEVAKELKIHTGTTKEKKEKTKKKKTSFDSQIS